MVTLFPDQQLAKGELYARARQGYKRPLLVAPTGWGKGTVAGDIIYDSVNKNPNNNILFVVNRRALVKDMSKRLTRLGIYHGILMGAKTRGAHMNVLIASEQTLRKRLKSIQKPNLVFVDEAHTFMSEGCQKLLSHLEELGAFIILMTATPWMLNGSGLGEIADTLIQGPTPDVLISTGRLVVPRIYAPKPPDTSNIKRNREGEFDEKESAEVMSDRKLIGDMVLHWKKLAPGLRTIGFATDKKTAELYATEFRAAGIRSVSINDETPDAERDRTWERLEAKELDVVWTVGLVSYGFDAPWLECIILARLTMSLALHLQQCGRVLRSFPGKLRGLILDHAGNTRRRYSGGFYGMPDVPRIWTLDARPRREDSDSEGAEDLPQVCPVFGINSETGRECPDPKEVLKKGTALCPVCGYEFHKDRRGPRDASLEHDKDGELVEVESRVYIYPESTGSAEKDRLMSVARDRGYDPKWVEFRMKALEDARLEFRKRFNKLPKIYWTTGQLRAMIRNAGKEQLSL